MAIRHAIDDVRRTLVIFLSGRVTGREFKAFAARLYGDRAELFDYDAILDLREYHGDVSYADLNPLREMYAAPSDAAHGGFGCIVTPDPHFQIWATALDAQFPGRTHVLVATLEEAFVRLDERRGSGAGREA